MQGEEVSVRKGQAQELFPLCAQIMSRPWDTSDQEVTADTPVVFISARPRAQVYEDNEGLSGVPASCFVKDKEDACLGQQTSTSNIFWGG